MCVCFYTKKIVLYIVQVNFIVLRFKAFKARPNSKSGAVRNRKRGFPLSLNENRPGPEGWCTEKSVNPVIVDGQLSVEDMPNFTSYCLVRDKERRIAHMRWLHNNLEVTNMGHELAKIS